MKRRAFLAGLVAAPIAAQLPAPSLAHLEGAAIIPYMPPAPSVITAIANIDAFRRAMVAQYAIRATHLGLRGTDA